MKKTIFGFICITSMLFPQFVEAVDLFKIHGDERVGTTALSFLKIGVGARAEGMAQAFVGVADDATALYWNPAGISHLKGTHFSLSIQKWPGNIDYNYMAVTRQLNETVMLGMAIAQLSTDEMDVTTVTHHNGNGSTFYFTDQAFQLSSAFKLTNQFSFGLSAKYVREDIDDIKMDGFLMDLGTFYQTGWHDMTIAVSLTNFGPVFRPDGTYIPANSDDGRAKKYEEFSPPTVFRLGSSMHLYDRYDHSVLATMQIDHPVDNLESYIFGLEYDWLDNYFLRGGYTFNSKPKSWTLGAGLNWEFNGMLLRLDFSYSDFDLLDNSQRSSIEIGW
jgi:hypothetical protein